MRSASSCSRLRRVRASVTVEIAARTSDSFLIAAYWGGKSIEISCSVSVSVSSSDVPGHNISSHEVEGLTVGSVLGTLSLEHDARSAPPMVAGSPGALSSIVCGVLAPQGLFE